MNNYVLEFSEINGSEFTLVGGKGANLGELSKISEIRVPEGFCVTTQAYKKTVCGNGDIGALIDRLSELKVSDRDTVSEISGQIRGLIEGLEITGEMREEIARHLAKLGAESTFAIRSSATAEDLPLASFAGQQDTFLNIRGEEAVLRNISKCWASLFTDRAVIYRMRNGFDHRKVYLSVVVQRMVFPQAAGILFTADPVTSNRKVESIDASFGLGEALVSGLVNPDQYKVRGGKIIKKKVSAKKAGVYSLPGGGTQVREIEPGRRNTQTLTDGQILELGQMGREIERHFACPQDVEWCLNDDVFEFVQSRPITTLFPVPEVNKDRNHVFMSVGHLQMMTDTIKPLGMSFLRLSGVPFPQLSHFGVQAGGRLFLEVTHDLASRTGSKILISLAGQSDLLMKSALSNLIERKDLTKTLPRGKRGVSSVSMYLPILWPSIKTYLMNDPIFIQKLIRRYETSIRILREKISSLSGDALFDFILRDQKELKSVVYDPRGMGAIMITLYARDWLNKNMEKWLGEKNAADTLSKSVANNVTSDMGLELLDVSDVVRQYPAVIEYLEHAADGTFFEDLAGLPGGIAISESMQKYLEKYGMRCPGEIDITRPRWNEKPTLLIPTILNNVKNLEPGAHQARFELGRREAEQKEREI